MFTINSIASMIADENQIAVNCLSLSIYFKTILTISQPVKQNIQLILNHLLLSLMLWTLWSRVGHTINSDQNERHETPNLITSQAYVGIFKAVSGQLTTTQQIKREYS